MIATMAVIFYFSGQNGAKSGAVGNAVAQTMSITPANEWVDESHKALLLGLNLRKWAHIGLCGLLGLCAAEWALSASKAVLICLGYAVFDETHQYFIPEREAKVMDVLIDFIGFITVILIVVGARKYITASKRQ